MHYCGLVRNFFISSAINLLQTVFKFCLPGFLFTCGFQSNACHVTYAFLFRMVCPIQVHFVLSISCLMLCWSDLLTNCVCDIVLQFYLEDVSEILIFVHNHSPFAIDVRLQNEGFVAGLKTGKLTGYCEGYSLGLRHGTELALEVTAATSHLQSLRQVDMYFKISCLIL